MNPLPALETLKEEKTTFDQVKMVKIAALTSVHLEKLRAQLRQLLYKQESQQLELTTRSFRNEIN
jgi:hypothetical protein